LLSSLADDDVQSFNTHYKPALADPIPPFAALPAAGNHAVFPAAMFYAVTIPAGLSAPAGCI